MRLCLPPLLIPAALMAQSGDAAWKADLLKARQEKDVAFKSGKTSPLAGLQRLNVEAGKPAGLRLKPDGLEMVEGEAPVTVRQKDGQWLWVTATGEAPMAGGAVFTLGRFHVQGQLGAERATLLVFDPERAEVRVFKGLRYFPPSRTCVVRATLEPMGGAESITLMTTRNLKKTFTPFARVRFTLGGRPQALTAYMAPGDDTMFIPFTDATTGKETYGVGRFLEIPAPKGQTFTLDFNTAFNPLCNYSGIWNCPLPPEENALRIPVRAGEKAYPGH